jgi:hypothetical protein
MADAHEQAPPDPAPETGSDGSGRVLGWFVAIPLVAVALLFMPLLLAIAEGLTLGSEHVEDFFRTIGLHDELGEIYESVFDLFSSLVP